MGSLMKYAGVTLMGCGLLYVLAFFFINKGASYLTARK